MKVSSTLRVQLPTKVLVGLSVTVLKSQSEAFRVRSDPAGPCRVSTPRIPGRGSAGRFTTVLHPGGRGAERPGREAWSRDAGEARGVPGRIEVAPVWMVPARGGGPRAVGWGLSPGSPAPEPAGSARVRREGLRTGPEVPGPGVRGSLAWSRRRSRRADGFSRYKEETDDGGFLVRPLSLG